MWAGRTEGLEFWSLLLQVLVVSGDGHKLQKEENNQTLVKTSFWFLILRNSELFYLVLVSRVQVIPRLRVVGLVPAKEKRGKWDQK